VVATYRLLQDFFTNKSYTRKSHLVAPMFFWAMLASGKGLGVFLMIFSWVNPAVVGP